MDAKEKSMTFFETTVRSAVTVIVMTMLVSVPFNTHAQKTGTDKIASVNEVVLLRQDLDREMKQVSFKLKRQGRPLNAEQMKRYESRIRETMINRSLLLQQAQSEGIEASNRLVDKALDEFKSTFPDDNAFQQALTEMETTEEQIQNQFRDGLTIKALIDKEVVQQISVTDAQVRKYYDDNPDTFRRPEQVKASHILIKVPENASEAQKANALAAIEALKVRIDNGENFAVLAQEHSDCPSKSKGGDLGFFGSEQMVPPFSKAAFDLQPGQVSEVVETRFGYHLIKLTERQEAQKLAFNDVKDEIATRLRQEQERTEIDKYIQKLTKEADIQRFPL
jgi:peptidyl-prolyl cis-trans isomerase C